MTKAESWCRTRRMPPAGICTLAGDDEEAAMRVAVAVLATRVACHIQQLWHLIGLGSFTGLLPPMRPVLDLYLENWWSACAGILKASIQTVERSHAQGVPCSNALLHE